MNYKALYEKQEEIIVCYKNIMAGWLECISDLDRLESDLSALKAMKGEDVSDEVRDYFDLIYDNIPVSVDNCILPDHAREELANILNAAMRDNLIKKG